MDDWIQKKIEGFNDYQIYRVNVTAGRIYAINWDDSTVGSDIYSCDITVTACRDNFTAYFSGIDTGYQTPQYVIAKDNIIFIRVARKNSYQNPYPGTFALKISQIKLEPQLTLSQGNTVIGNGTTYSFGDIAMNSSQLIVFAIKNNGNGQFSTVNTPDLLKVSGNTTDFKIESKPAYSIDCLAETNFVIRFSPTDTENKTATVSIYNGAITFTITGKGSPEEVLTADNSWHYGELLNKYHTKGYSVAVTRGKTYSVGWDSRTEGTGQYSGNIEVNAYSGDKVTPYFSRVYGYTTPQVIVARDEKIYLEVSDYLSSSSNINYALKVAQINEPKPIMGIKQDTNIISKGAVYNFGSIPINSSREINFMIQNSGTSNLILPGIQSQRVIIVNDEDDQDSSFRILEYPGSPMIPGYGTSFKVCFNPTSTGSTGVKTATVKIATNESSTPFTFQITGVATAEETLTVNDDWKNCILEKAWETRVYRIANLDTTKKYMFRWAKGYDFNSYANIYISAYNLDFSEKYFSTNDHDSSRQTIIPLENEVYLKVTSGGTGSYKLMVSEAGSDSSWIGVKYMSNNGQYDFGTVSVTSTRSAQFTIRNYGDGGEVVLTDPIKIIDKTTGKDSEEFTVSVRPSKLVLGPDETTTFTVDFIPTSEGSKTAQVIIPNSSTPNPYLFNLYAVAVPPSTLPLTLEILTNGSLQSGDVKYYSFTATPNQKYAVYGSTYSRISVLKKDLTTTYGEVGSELTNYQMPLIITAQEELVYLKVQGSYSAYQGNYSIKVSATIPEPKISVRQGSNIISSGTEESYSLGTVPVGAPCIVKFTIENTGDRMLKLTGDPLVEITGINASQFRVSSFSTTIISPGSRTLFYRKLYSDQCGSTKSSHSDCK